jgi:DNA invertase Pin-like site-specific DNA recombinase
MEGKFIAYYRVSTDHQGVNGNGMAAQRKAVEDYLNGGRWKLVGEFTEVESGKRSDRPELEKALTACRKNKAKLVIAKLDRLSRNVLFISGLMERKVDFVACDMPSANAFMINVYAAVARGTPHDQRPHQSRPRGGQGARRQARRPATARNQRKATGGRPRASTGHCADSLGVGWNVGPLHGCGVERAPGRDAKRRAEVCQDRHPGAGAVGSLGEAGKQSVMDCNVRASPDPSPRQFIPPLRLLVCN